VFEVAEDLVAYCKGEREGTDLQLSDSHDLPRAEAVAEEELAIERGFDEDGLPFDESDQRYFELPRLGGTSDAEIEVAMDEWLHTHGFTLDSGD